jgi:hypothetical protein
MNITERTTTFYARGDGTWTVLGYDSIDDWLMEQDKAAVEVVPASQLAGAVEALEYIAEVNTALAHDRINWRRTAEIMREKAILALVALRGQ